jgi:hypothetical protein
MDSFEIKIEDKPNDAEGLLTGLFRPGNKAYDLLKNAIEREFRPNGAPEVTRMTVDRITYSATTGNGSFRVLLDISYTFGCEDLVTQKNNETSEWTFEIDAGNGILTCYSSPYADGRSTADEF